jgi:hypothetical protein
VWRLSPSEDEAGKDGEAGIFAGYVDAAGRRWPMPQPARDATKILKTLRDEFFAFCGVPCRERPWGKMTFRAFFVVTIRKSQRRPAIPAGDESGVDP